MGWIFLGPAGSPSGLLPGTYLIEGLVFAAPARGLEVLAMNTLVKAPHYLAATRSQGVTCLDLLKKPRKKPRSS